MMEPRDGPRLTATNLTPAQLRAVGVLASGGGVEEAAEAASVHRASIWRWTRDPGFAAELNRIRLHQRERLATRLEALAEMALDVAADALDRRRDRRVALAVLRGVGLLAGHLPPVGCDDAEVLSDQAATAKLRALEERRRAEREAAREGTSELDGLLRELQRGQPAVGE